MSGCAMHVTFITNRGGGGGGGEAGCLKSNTPEAGASAPGALHLPRRARNHPENHPGLREA